MFTAAVLFVVRCFRAGFVPGIELLPIRFLHLIYLIRHSSGIDTLQYVVGALLLFYGVLPTAPFGFASRRYGRGAWARVGLSYTCLCNFPIRSFRVERFQRRRYKCRPAARIRVRMIDASSPPQTETQGFGLCSADSSFSALRANAADTACIGPQDILGRCASKGHADVAHGSLAELRHFTRMSALPPKADIGAAHPRWGFRRPV
jgi:hypothetical protein